MAARDLRPHSPAARRAAGSSGTRRPAVVRVAAPANDNRPPLLRVARPLAWLAAAAIAAALLLP